MAWVPTAPKRGKSDPKGESGCRCEQTYGAFHGDVESNEAAYVHVQPPVSLTILKPIGGL
jgi:hypothetical protein